MVIQPETIQQSLILVLNRRKYVIIVDSDCTNEPVLPKQQYAAIYGENVLSFPTYIYPIVFIRSIKFIEEKLIGKSHQDLFSSFWYHVNISVGFEITKKKLCTFFSRIQWRQCSENETGKLWKTTDY